MIKIQKYDSNKIYMFPNGGIATYDEVLNRFPAVERFTHIIETDESGEVLFAVQNLSAVKSQLGIDQDLSETESIAKIEEIRNTEEEYVPSPEERIASALEWQNVLSL